MKLPFEAPAIFLAAHNVIETGRNRIIETRRKFVAGIVSGEQWLSMHRAFRRRVALANRAMSLHDSVCGFLIAQSLVKNT